MPIRTRSSNYEQPLALSANHCNNAPYTDPRYAPFALHGLQGYTPSNATYSCKGYAYSQYDIIMLTRPQKEEHSGMPSPVANGRRQPR